MRRFLLCAALAAIPFFAHADTPAALDSKALGPPDRVLFWTPEQQQASYPNMDRIFLTREISRGDPKTHPAYPLPVALEDLSKVSFEVAGKRYTIGEYLEHNHVAGLLVIHNGKIAYERYALGHTATSKWTSFSVAKSLTSMLVGAAIKDGYIKDVNDPVTSYLPVLKGTSYEGVTIRQVLQMSSGVGWNEDYTDPKSDVAQIGAVAAQGGSLGLVKYMGDRKSVV